MDNTWWVVLVIFIIVIVVVIAILLIFFLRPSDVPPSPPTPTPSPTPTPTPIPTPILPVIEGTVNQQSIIPMQRQIVNWLISGGNNVIYSNGTFTLSAGVYTIHATLTYRPAETISQYSIGVWVRDINDNQMTNILGVTTETGMLDLTTTISLPTNFRITLDRTQNVSILTSQNSPDSLLVSGNLTIRHVLLNSSYNGPAVSLFQWNVHWQCFTNSCCSTVAIRYINSNLLSRKVDFANIIELESASYSPPSPYRAIVGHCGSGAITRGDVTTLIYNSTLWTPVGSSHKFCINDAGTESNSGRPTMIQEFSSIQQSSFRVWVVGSHFTHDRNTYVSALRRAFSSVGITSSSNIAFMADTNQRGSSDTLMTDMIGSRPSNIQATKVSGTCCYSGFHLPYDRIITTFGNSMHTSAPTFNEVIPHPVSGCNYGEMHLPIYGVVG